VVSLNKAASVSLSLAPNPVTVGKPVTATMTVSGSAGTPTGTVTLTRVTGSTGKPVFVRTLSGGRATLSYPQNTTGTFVYRADYAGDSTYAAGQSSEVSLTVKPKATPTVK
jgi:hypothetical protein